MIKAIIILLLISRTLFSQTEQTIITNVNLFDGVNVIKNTNVVFKDGIIVDVTNDRTRFEGSSMIDGNNKTIIPPLINAHVHVWLSNNLKDALDHGVFALLDMHTTDEYANSLRQYNDSMNYAEYYSSNAGATVRNGHGTQFGIKVPIITDTITPSQFVKDRVNNHADYIKILKEPLRPTLSDDQTKEVIEEAHRQNKIAVAHVSKIENADKLTSQGIDGFVHVWFDKPAPENTLESMKRQNVFIVPTLIVIKKLMETMKDKDWVKNSMKFEDVINEVTKAYKTGIPILTGTDSPNFGLNYSSDLYEEMFLLSKAGLSNIDVIKASTVNVYNAFDLKHFGQIEIGNNANFILINGNPIDNLEEIKNDKIIFKNGIIINNN